MKKISKIKKSKIVEKVKTVLIVLLLFSCLFLNYQIFGIYREQTLDDSLWNGLNSINENAISKTVKEESSVDIFRRLSKPEIVVVNNNRNRILLANSKDDFKILSDTANMMIYDMYGLGEDELFQSSKGEWQTALKINSVYLRYPANRSVGYEAEIYQQKNGGVLNMINTYSEALLIPAGAQTVTALLRDKLSDTIIGAKLNSNAAKTLSELLKKYDVPGERKYTFACELNLDAEADGKAALDSMLLINTDPIKMYDILVDVPKLYRTGLNFTKSTEFVTGLINIFGYNPNTVRQYVSSEDALTFVGETGSLSIYPEGKVEYKALGPSEGVALAAGQTGVSPISLGLCNIMEQVLMVSGVEAEGNDFDIEFTQMPQNIKAGEKAEFCFDYFVDGRRVVFGESPAVYATVENGVLVELVIQVRNIKRLMEETTVDSIFSEIDRFCNTNPESKYISSGDIVYMYNKNGEKIKAKWQLSDMR